MNAIHFLSTLIFVTDCWLDARGKSLLLQPFSGRIGSCNWDKVALAVGIPASESDYYQHKPNFRNTFV